MKKPRIVTSSSNNKSESSWLRKVFWNLIGPIVTGLIIATAITIVQIYVNPKIAKGVKIQESIVQKRYESFDKAIELLLRSLASAEITGENVPEGYKPQEKAPSQLEIQTAYLQLVIYNKSQTIAKQFLTATGPNRIETSDVVKFVSTVRKELGIDDKDITNLTIRLIPPVGEDGLRNKEEKGL